MKILKRYVAVYDEDIDTGTYGEIMLMEVKTDYPYFIRAKWKRGRAGWSDWAKTLCAAKRKARKEMFLPPNTKVKWTEVEV